jgi:hypothetical protein
VKGEVVKSDGSPSVLVGIRLDSRYPNDGVCRTDVTLGSRPWYGSIRGLVISNCCWKFGIVQNAESSRARSRCRNEPQNRLSLAVDVPYQTEAGPELFLSPLGNVDQRSQPGIWTDQLSLQRLINLSPAPMLRMRLLRICQSS